MLNTITTTSLTTASLADRLRALRTDRGWSLRRVARETGLDTATWSRWECGHHTPTLRSLHGIAAAFGVPVGWLVGGHDQAA